MSIVAICNAQSNAVSIYCSIFGKGTYDHYQLARSASGRRLLEYAENDGLCALAWDVLPSAEPWRIWIEVAFDTLTLDTPIYPMLPIMLEMIEAVYAEEADLMIVVEGDEPFVMLHHADAAALADSMCNVLGSPLLKDLLVAGEGD